MVNVGLYHFTKRENSTKRPSENSGNGQDHVYVGEIKEGTSILSPTIAFKFDAGFSPRSLNYAYIPTFDRFYFIKDWRWAVGIWYADMQVDTLATWKIYIEQSTEYVLRSSAESNGNVLDMYYPATAIPTISRTTALSGWVNDMSQGWFVVGIINQDGNALSAISYYALSQAAMKSLKTALLGSSEWLYNGITEISQELTRALVNPYQFIASCMWFPVEPPTWYSTSSLRLGWWEVGSFTTSDVGGIGKTPTKIYNGSIAIPKHPQAATRGAYLNSAPYSSYMLDFRPFGYLALDAQQLATTSTLYWQYQLDFINGGATLRLSTKSDYTDSILITSAQVGVPIQLAQYAVDTVGVIEGAGKAAGGIAGIFTGAIGQGISDAASGVANALQAAAPKATTSGSTGSFAGISKAIELIGTFQQIVPENNAARGRPLCESKLLSTIPGFIMVTDPQIALPSTQQELQSVRSYMTGGFYLE